MATHLNKTPARPETPSLVKNHGFSGIVVADCIYTHSQLTDQEQAGFVRTFLDIGDIDSLDIERMSSRVGPSCDGTP